MDIYIYISFEYYVEVKERWFPDLGKVVVELLNSFLEKNLERTNIL